jgi:hypothetical protein
MANDAHLEWVGGLAQIPVRIEDEGIFPEGLFWLGPNGVLLRSEMGRPGELAARVGASLRDAMERPLIGGPHRPRRLRVASAELAARIRDEHPDIDVVCAATPEVDAAVDDLMRHLREGRRQRDAYLASDAEPDAMASFFRAAAHLYGALPRVRRDQFVLATIDDLGVNLATVAVMGHGPAYCGLLVFWSSEDAVAFMDAADAIVRGEAPGLPPHLALTFGTIASAEVAAEVVARGWSVAADDGFPSIRVFEDGGWRQHDAREMAILEALALALPPFLDLVRAASDGQDSVSQLIAVAAHRGRTVVKLLALSDRDRKQPGSRDDRRARKARRRAQAKARRKNR